MATKQELLNAMKVIKEHCESFEFDQCSKCEILKLCKLNFDKAKIILPDKWDLEEGETK